MKHILFIAPHSFPIKSSESICNSKVAYVLAKAGYNVDVFTCDDNSTYPADSTIDNLLRSPKNLKIFSVKNDHHISYRTYGLAKGISNIFYNLRIFLKTGYFYLGINTAYDILKAINKQIEKYGKMPYDVVITRGFNTDYAGLYMAKKYGIKWIANWNDPYPNVRFPFPYGKGYDTALPKFEQKIYDEIQKYITVYTYPNPRLRDYMLKCFTRSTKEQTIVIPHMALSEISIRKVKNDSILRMVHCGSVKSPRDPRLFLKALANISQKHNQTIECFFIGEYDNDISSLINRDSYLKSVVHLLPAKRYNESISFLSSCDVNLIIEAQCEEGIYLPTKFVDSIQTGLPIFCVSPIEGMMHDLTQRFHIGYCSDNTSISDIENKLLTLIDDYSKNLLPVINKDKIPEFFEDDILKQYQNLL